MKHKRIIWSSKSNRFFYKRLLSYLLSNKYGLVFLALSTLLVFFCGVDDKESINLYLNRLQLLSEHKIMDEQRAQISTFYCINDNRHPLQDERHHIRHEFNSKKRKLKQEWEAKYKIAWPQTVIRVKADNNNDTKIAVEKERDYEAHHIVPINAGGVNQWWNISPLSSKNHKLLHESIEEKACFSHDFVHQKIVRFMLKVQTVFAHHIKRYINKKGTNYAKEPLRKNSVNIHSQTNNV